MNKPKLSPNFDGSQMKRVRDNKPNGTSTWQRVSDNFSHMGAIKYMPLCVNYIMVLHTQSQHHNAETKLC